MFWGILTGFVLGTLVLSIGLLIIRAGVLVVYIPNQYDEPPYLYTELNRPVDNLRKKKYVIFRVDVRPLDSQN